MFQREPVRQYFYYCKVQMFLVVLFSSYQIKISLKRTKLSSSKIFGENCIDKFVNIANVKGVAGI